MISMKIAPNMLMPAQKEQPSQEEGLSCSVINRKKTFQSYSLPAALHMAGLLPTVHTVFLLSDSSCSLLFDEVFVLSDSLVSASSKAVTLDVRSVEPLVRPS